MLNLTDVRYTWGNKKKTKNTYKILVGKLLANKPSGRLKWMWQ